MEVVGHEAVSDDVHMWHDIYSYLFEEYEVVVRIAVEQSFSIIPLIVDVVESFWREFHFERQFR